MEIVVKPVCSRSDLRKFIHLPAKIHKDHLNWIPPLYSDEWEFFNARKNKAYGYSDVILLLAYRGKKEVGRVMGIVHKEYNELHHQKYARFNYLESWDDREVIEELYTKVAQRALRNNPGIEILEFTKRKNLKPWIRPIFTLINDTFKEIYGFTPFTLEEMDDFANRYLLIMDPRLIKIILNERKETVAFVIGMPDISKGIKKSKGYLIPIGILHILLAGRRTRQLNLLLGAVHPDYQNRGLDTILGSAMLDSAREQKMEYIDSHLEMETNTKVRAEMEYMGGEVYKTYRVFGKALGELPTKEAEETSRKMVEAECI